MLTMGNGDIARYCITLKNDDGSDPVQKEDLLDGIDGFIYRHAGRGVLRDGSNRWYIGYGSEDQGSLSELMAMGTLIKRSERVKAAGLTVFWKEPGYPEVRM